MSGPQADLSEADGELVGAWQRDWYQAHVPFWNSLPVVAVSDLREVESAMSELVHGVPAAVSQEFVETQALARDVAQFMWARCSAQSAPEYLDRIARARQLRTDNVADDLMIQRWYRILVGRVPPSRLDSGELLAEFWTRSGHPANQIVKLSTDGWVEMRPTKPFASASDTRSLQELIHSVFPEWPVSSSELAERWGSPYDRGFPMLTENKGVSLEGVLRKHGTTYFSLVNLVGESQNGIRVPLKLLLYLSPDEHRWHVLWFTNQHIGDLGRPY